MDARVCVATGAESPRGQDRTEGETRTRGHERRRRAGPSRDRACSCMMLGPGPAAHL